MSMIAIPLHPLDVDVKEYDELEMLIKIRLGILTEDSLKKSSEICSTNFELPSWNFRLDQLIVAFKQKSIYEMPLLINHESLTIQILAKLCLAGELECQKNNVKNAESVVGPSRPSTPTTPKSGRG